jgi:hypothetical protein
MTNRHDISGQIGNIKLASIYFDTARLGMIAEDIGCNAAAWSDSKPWPASTKEVL